MALAVQQSLFEVDSGAPMVESARWIENAMLGEIALGICVIAVALIGALTLSGRLPIREGMRIVVGCFVLLSAPVIAAAFVAGGGSEFSIEPSPQPSGRGSIDTARPPLPAADYDPYAGASLNQN